MSFIELILMIALIGFICWAITFVIPMGPFFERAIYVICILAVAYQILGFFGVLPVPAHFHVPPLHK